MKIGIWITLIILFLFFTYVFIKDIVKHRKVLESSSTLKTGLIGFVVNFFDVLGIGAFAPQTALLKFTKQTEDRSNNETTMTINLCYSILIYILTNLIHQ